MKKKTVRFATLAFMTGLLVCACQVDKHHGTGASESKAVALVMDRITTRSDMGTTLQVNNYRVGTDSSGNALYLEEVVTELDGLGTEVAETRGTPTYTENVTSVFGDTFNGVALTPTGTQIIGDGAFKEMGIPGKSVWRRELGYDPWENTDQLHFFLRLPATATGVTNLAYDPTASNGAGSIAFDYETPLTAATQQDILFASRRVNEDTYFSEFASSGGASVLFRHALTGVKFAIGNNTLGNNDPRHPSGQTQTFITEVSITGLKDKGHAVFIPTGTETGSQVDDITEHTSADSFTWTDISGASGTTLTTVFSQTYGENDIRNFESGDSVGAPSSFYAAGQEHNLNDGNASLTFWFIPQAITSALKLTVKFKVWDGQNLGAEKTVELNLGALILAQEDKYKPGTSELLYTNKVWKAGQLRTFTLSPLLMAIEITDTVSGYSKNNVVVRNTGNVKAFLRAHIVANWYGTTQEGVNGVAVGYAASTGYTYRDGWRMDTTTNPITDNYGGTFTGLPGTNWVKSGNYYYYTVPVDPGASTTALFTSYNLPLSANPSIWYPFSANGVDRKAFTNVHLEMDIPVQAIEAKTGKTYQQAWAEAGVTLP